MSRSVKSGAAVVRRSCQTLRLCINPLGPKHRDRHENSTQQNALRASIACVGGVKEPPKSPALARASSDCTVSFGVTMSPRFSTIALLLLLLVLSAFVWISSSALPEVVASHFGSSGAADGYMPRGTYIALLLVLIVGVPLLLALLPAAVAGSGGKNLNIPNREFWLAPERRASTLASIRLHGLCFAAAVALFMAYVHWLVVQANALRPAHLSMAGITAGLSVSFLLLVVWLAVLYARFRRHG